MARDLLAPGLRDLQPGAADLAEQPADFVEPFGLVLRIRLHEARAHVFVERVEIVGDVATGLEVEAVAQLVDDRDRAVQELRLLGAAAVRHEAARLSTSLTDRLTDKADIALRTKALNAKSVTLQKSAADLEVRMAEVTRRYNQQFNALDSMLSNMQQQSSFLTQQLSQIAIISK